MLPEDTLDDYLQSGMCEKCGANNEGATVTTEQAYNPDTKKWVDSKRHVTSNISTTFVRLPATANCLCGVKGDTEHLHRRCLVCGYYWAEKTMGSK
jgi:hypothetical protein